MDPETINGAVVGLGSFAGTSAVAMAFVIAIHRGEPVIAFLATAQMVSSIAIAFVCLRFGGIF